MFRQYSGVWTYEITTENVGILHKLAQSLEPFNKRVNIVVTNFDSKVQNIFH